MEILRKAKKILNKYPICDYCLGRQFALLGYGIENRVRGYAIKLLLTMDAHRKALTGNKRAINFLKKLAFNGNFEMAYYLLEKLTNKKFERKEFICHLCNNNFQKIEQLAEKASERMSKYEYSTFLVGIFLPTGVEEREDEFKAEFGIIHGESLKNHFSREIGKKIAEKTGKKADLKRPDIVALINPFKNIVRLQVNPLYIYGRYRKLVRNLPQSMWICTKCMGKGCEACNWTGKRYPESVAELISAPVLEMTKGERTAFHAAGREDIDARMLGTGRPFVIEVKKPRKRFIDLWKLENAINNYANGKIEVLGLTFASREDVERVKRGEKTEKTYRVIVELEREVSDEDLRMLESALTNCRVSQQTPIRVLHRRADKTREKYIYETKVNKLTPKMIELRIRCQGGLYIKELVTGDMGRTKPSVSEILKVKAVPLELDVINVNL
ncbi:tRNA pseudouridine(54/55) synthase Pus10 [Candidatus Bathyarchaeota archaeon]|nr:tRNA pseudouridine(54/55) synthase Pus10 [Candidatus Bathyarchaeota archaeon]